MIDALQSSVETCPLDPIVASLLHHHPRAHEVRAAWEAVRQFVEDARVSALHQPDAEILLLAKALDACSMESDARKLATLSASAAPLRGNLPLAQLSVSTLCAMAVGALRCVPESALAPGAVLVLDAGRLQRGAEHALDFAVMPAFRALLNDALRILDAQSRPGLLITKGWSSGNDARREAAEQMFVRVAGADTPHRFLWMY